MNELEIKGLIVKAVSGDQLSWNELIIKYQRRVFVSALAVVRNVDDADEITQEVFIKLYKNIANINNPVSLNSWLVRCAYNLACDHCRFKKIRAWLLSENIHSDDVVSENLSVEAAVGRSQTAKIFNDWSHAKLSNKERLVLQLKVGEEMTLQEIADSLNISLSSSKTHYFRAKDKLNDLIKMQKRDFYE